MTGHPRPCRTSARHHSRFARPKPSMILLLIALVALLAAGSLLAVGCGSDAADETTVPVAPSTTSLSTDTTVAEPAQDTFPVTVTDDNGNSVTIEAEPVRIVSTAPANTETLFALGVGERVVGVNALDDYPAEVADIEKVGDFTLNTEATMALSPDLVVAYSGNEEAVAPIQQAGIPVLIMNPATVDGIYANITTIGAATGANQEAATLVEQLRAQIGQISDTAAGTGESPTVFYALDNTLWTVGPGSFVDELLTLAHCTNVAAAPGADGVAAQAYYQFAPEQLVAADPDVILLPGSIYASAEEFTADPRFTGLSAVKNGTVYVIEDVIVTRPGPRIGTGLEILAAAIHPGAF